MAVFGENEGGDEERVCVFERPRVLHARCITYAAHVRREREYRREKERINDRDNE